MAISGACYRDIAIIIEDFPPEDDKIRARDVQVRRGGNGPNTSFVLAGLVQHSIKVKMHVMTWVI